MSCVTDTPAIDLNVAAGLLSATLVVSPDASNMATVHGNGLYVGGDGWVPLPAVLTFGSAGGTMYTATTGGVDLTGVVSPGMKLKVTQGGTVRYFVVMAVSGTTLTLYGGDTQILSAVAITLPFYSVAETPRAYPSLGGADVITVAEFLGVSNLIDKMELVVVDSLTAPTYGFHLKYRSSISDAYKWLCIGGSPLYSAVDAQENVSSVTYADSATPGPTVVAPLAGTYDLDYRNMAFATSAQFVYSAPSIGGAAPSSANEVFFSSQAAGYFLPVSQQRRVAAIGASSAIKLQYKVNSGTGQVASRTLRAMPVRVSQ